MRQKRRQLSVHCWGTRSRSNMSSPPTSLPSKDRRLCRYRTMDDDLCMHSPTHLQQCFNPSCKTDGHHYAPFFIQARCARLLPASDPASYNRRTMAERRRLDKQQQRGSRKMCPAVQYWREDSKMIRQVARWLKHLMLLATEGCRLWPGIVDTSSRPPPNVVVHCPTCAYRETDAVRSACVHRYRHTGRPCSLQVAEYCESRRSAIMARVMALRGLQSNGGYWR